MTERPGTRTRAAATLGYLLIATLVACGPAPTASAPTESAPASRSSSPPSAEPAPTEPYTGYPDSLAIIGHSGATGEATVPYNGTDTKTNSWASGINPAVRSVYLRLVEENPDAQGNVANLATGGATNSELREQAAAVTAMDPQPDLVLISGIDNDVVCPAMDSDYASFGDGFEEVLRVLADGAPATRVMVFSQLGRPGRYIRALDPAERAAVGGTGPCTLSDPQGRVIGREVRRLTRIIAAYDAKARQRCAKFELCSFDEGAFTRVVETRRTIAEDLNHLSVAGHAAVAAAAWAALRDAGLMPVR